MPSTAPRSATTSVYVAAQGLRQGGWRFQSQADYTRLYADFGRRTDRGEFHLVAAGAISSLGVAAATPDTTSRSWTTERSSQRRRRPTTRWAWSRLNGKYALTDTWSLQGNAYIRGFAQDHVDGNGADVERCSNSSSPQFINHLCLQDDGFPRPNPVTAAFHNQFAILDQNNNPIPCPPGSGNTCNTTPWGTIDRTANHATTLGASLQAASTEKLFDHGNNFLVGGAIDYSRGNFNADSTLGIINPDLTVTADPAIPGTGSIIHTLGGFGYAPVDTNTRNAYYGVYALDTFDIDERLSATAGMRFNIANVAVSDQLGTSPDLNSSQTYTHFNPVTGFTYKLTPDLTGYFGYSQANRAPTPLEQSCSNPANPCLLENFLVSDPPLKQVVATTYEVGLRQSLPLYDGKLEWKTALFRTDSTDDIINVASIIQGRGFFQNVPGTRRQGVEAGIQYHSTQWFAYAGYSLIDATYQFSGDLPSPNNPMADANGNVHVAPGNRIPGIPLNQGKLGLYYMPTPEWTVGADMAVVGPQYSRRRRRQSEHQAARLLAGQPARFLSGHQAGTALWAYQQRVRQTIRAVRNFFRPGRRRECKAADRIDRPPHRSPGAAIGRLRRHPDHVLSRQPIHPEMSMDTVEQATAVHGQRCAMTGVLLFGVGSPIVIRPGSC